MPPRKRKIVKPTAKDEKEVGEIVVKQEINEKDIVVKDQPKLASNPVRISIAGLKLQPISMSNLKILPKGSLNFTPSPRPVTSTPVAKSPTEVSTPKTQVNFSTTKIIPFSASGLKFSQLKLSSAMSLNPLAKSSPAQVQTPKSENFKQFMHPIAKPLTQSRESSNRTKLIAKPLSMGKIVTTPSKVITLSNKRPPEEKSDDISPKRSSRRIVKVEDPLKTPSKSVKQQLKSRSLSIKTSSPLAILKDEPGSSNAIKITTLGSESVKTESPPESRRTRGIRININVLLGRKEPQSPSKKPKIKPKALVKVQKPEQSPIIKIETLEAPQDGQFACKKCPLFFDARKDFMNHRKIHKKSNFDCEKCGQTFKFQSSFLNHMCDFWCEYCGKTISNKANLKIHISYVHGIGDAKYFTCDLCGRIYKSKRNIDTHMKNHMESTPFNCAICSKGFSHLGALKIHMWNHRDSVDCEYCGRKFKPRSLYYHVKKCLYAQEVLGESVRNVRRVSMKEEHLDEEVIEDTDYALSNYEIEIVNDED